LNRFILFCISVMAVCSSAACAKKDITVSEAASLLQKNPPGKMTRSIPKDLRLKSEDEAARREFIETRETAERLASAGYVLVESAPGNPGGFKVTATGKLRPFVVNESPDSINVKVAEIVVDQVISVANKTDMADISYTTRVSPNELASFFGTLRNPVSGEIHATFKYSRGRWR
jgi:hypothetical protein